MNLQKLNSTQKIKLLAALVALVVLIDFAIPGKTFRQEITEVKTKHQQYYNAAGNSHLTYHAQTKRGEIMLSETVAREILPGDTLVFRESMLFHANNGFYAPKVEKASFSRHSMRWFAGLVFPIIILITMLYKWPSTTRLSNFEFVMLMFLLADLGYLLFF